jgi:hypothetical protein
MVVIEQSLLSLLLLQACCCCKGVPTDVQFVLIPIRYKLGDRGINHTPFK